MKLMLEAGMSGIDARDGFGGTPLYRAAENGHEGVLKLLLETGMIDIDAKDSSRSRWKRLKSMRATMLNSRDCVFFRRLLSLDF